MDTMGALLVRWSKFAKRHIWTLTIPNCYYFTTIHVKRLTFEVPKSFQCRIVSFIENKQGNKNNDKISKSSKKIFYKN